MSGYREKTIDVLSDFFSGEISRLAPVRNQIFDSDEIPNQNRGVFNDVLYGIVRRYRSLDAVISTYSDYPLNKLEPDVHEILRLAIYEILFLDSVPDPVSVNEAVNLANQRSSSSSGNFVNAILRSVLRDLTEEYWDLPESPTASGIEYLFPVRGETCREFSQSIMPAPHGGTESVVSFISTVFNYPDWIVEKWIHAYGEEDTWSIARHQVRIPPLFLRRNPLNCDASTFEAAFQSENIDVEETEVEGFYRVNARRHPRELPGYDNGWFTVQNPATGAVVNQLSPEPDSTVLDLCAAPGGKSTGLRERSEGSVRVVSLDVNRNRLLDLVENKKRLGHEDIFPLCADGRFPPFEPFSFDTILLDVPCSNTGVLADRVEARYHLENGLDEELVSLQTQLLESALELLSPEGQLLYCSCSLLPEENGERLSEVLTGRERIRLQKPKVTFPTKDIPSGGFSAVMESGDFPDDPTGNGS